LKEIDFSNNQLSSLEGLDTFTKLKRLYASNNVITSVSLNTHVNLKCLDLSNNRLKRMPDLNSLVNLHELYLNNNGMEFCDYIQIEKCTKLTILNFSSNLLDYLHEELENLLTFLASLKKLEDLNYSDNPFSSNLVDFRGNFLSRLTNLKKLNGIIASKQEKKYEKEIEIIFVDDLKKKLDNTSAALVKIPSFHHIRENPTTSFSDIFQNMKDIPEDFVVEVCQKLLETLLDFSNHSKR
jgi:Leucine-rich repeat (LRR) protein